MSDKMIVCCLKCIAVDTQYTSQSSEYIASCDSISCVAKSNDI